MPKVSVIIPVYGVEKYIERCARSLFEQTLDDIEFIFVDDCTSDRSMEILASIIEEYRFRFAEKRYVVRTEKMPTNCGQAAVRRHGIQLATGDYIIHCDSDDWVDVNAYKQMWNVATSNAVDMVICNFTRTDGVISLINNQFPSAQFLSGRDTLHLLLNNRIPTSVWTKLVKSHLYKDSSLLYPVANMWEDFLYSIQLANNCANIAYVDKPLYYYYYNPNSICNTYLDKRCGQMKMNCDIMLSYLINNSLYHEDEDDIIMLKNLCRSELQLWTNRREYNYMWRSIYPEINTLFFKSGLSIKEKIKFLLIYIGAYRYVYNFILKWGKNEIMF